MAQLGYGDGDEATTVGFGPDANNKFITTYFRRAFNVTNASLFTNLTLRLMRDDGAVVYLNGVEVWRTNMPTATVGFATPASVAIAGADESTFVQTTISPSLLVSGTNVLAIELHQSGGTSTDISFDLQLIGSDGSASVTRGPYLQIGTQRNVAGSTWRNPRARGPAGRSASGFQRCSRGDCITLSRAPPNPVHDSAATSHPLSSRISMTEGRIV